ncbi:MAG: transposase [Caldilineaceae bacterium]
MPQKRPPYLAGKYYHFYNRGRSRLSIFHGDSDYLQVLYKIKEYLQKFELTMIAYCLMPNHYHFLVRQDGELRAGLLPQSIFNSYAKSYNHRYKHSGTIFEGNYRVKLVDRIDYLLHLCRYIHANPVKDGIAANLTLWPYSNYLEWIEARDGTIVDRAFVHTYFQNPVEYTAFVQNYIRSRELPRDVQQYLAQLEL